MLLRVRSCLFLFGWLATGWSLYGCSQNQECQLRGAELDLTGTPWVFGRSVSVVDLRGSMWSVAWDKQVENCQHFVLSHWINTCTLGWMPYVVRFWPHRHSSGFSLFRSSRCRCIKGGTQCFSLIFGFVPAPEAPWDTCMPYRDQKKRVRLAHSRFKTRVVAHSFQL